MGSMSQAISRGASAGKTGARVLSKRVELLLDQARPLQHNSGDNRLFLA